MAEHGTLKVEVRRRLDRDLHGPGDLDIEKYQIIFAKSKDELGTHASRVLMCEASRSRHRATVHSPLATTDPVRILCNHPLFHFPLSSTKFSLLPDPL
jgi:hypothetical protein